MENVAVRQGFSTRGAKKHSRGCECPALQPSTSFVFVEFPQILICNNISSCPRFIFVYILLNDYIIKSLLLKFSISSPSLSLNRLLIFQGVQGHPKKTFRGAGITKG